MTEPTPSWSEDSSAVYRAIAQVAVPARAEQMAALLTLLPFGRDDQFHVVELASGEGRLAAALLDAFPNATLLALDGSPSMLEVTAQRLDPFGGRGIAAAFDIADDDWYPLVSGADAVVSSLCVHHLPGERKRDLYKEMARRLTPRGALLLADLIQPQRPEGWEFFAATYDAMTQARSQELVGSLDLYDQFVKAGWNYFRHPDAHDQPSPLVHQLLWMREAALAVVDCFWMRAGHAVYGGYRSADPNPGPTLPYADAWAAVQNALR